MRWWRKTLPSGWIGGRLDGSLGIGERLEHLVLDDDRLARAPGGLGMISGNRGDRLTRIEHGVGREHRLVRADQAVRRCRARLRQSRSPRRRGSATRGSRRAAGSGHGDAATAASCPTPSPRPRGRRRTRTVPAPSVSPSGRVGLAPSTARSLTTRVPRPVVSVSVMRRSARGPRLAPPRRCGRSPCSGRGCPTAPHGSRVDRGRAPGRGGRAPRR